MQIEDITVEREVVEPLVASACARCRFPDLALTDPWAERVVRGLEVPESVTWSPTLRATATRELALDTVVRGFLARRPGGLVISLYGGLSTRFFRTDDGLVHTLEIDGAATCALKRDLFPKSERLVLTEGCAPTCLGFVRHLRELRGLPVLVVSGAAFARAEASAVERFVTALSLHAPVGAEWVFPLDGERGLVSTERGCLVLTAGDTPPIAFPRARFTSDGSSNPPCVESALARAFKRPPSPLVAHVRFA